MMIHRNYDRFKTNEGYYITIINYRKAIDCDVIFDDGTIVTNLLYKSIINKTVKYPFHRTVKGVGFIGQGIYKTRENFKKTLAYTRWVNILERCYVSKNSIRNSSYKDCTVDERWHNFQNFAKWFENNYNLETMENWHLDKDILVKGNKIYSPETCAFVPNEINTIFSYKTNKKGNLPIGVCKYKKKLIAQCFINNKRVVKYFYCPIEAFNFYKNTKESHIKEVSDKWKDKIDTRVYNAMYNYKVEITD